MPVRRLSIVLVVSVLLCLGSVTASADCLTPDLSVSSLTAPKTATVGQPLSVEWVVTNLGPDPTEGAWYDTLYLSSDATLSADDVRLGEWRRTAGLSMGESYHRSVWVALSKPPKPPITNPAPPGNKQSSTPSGERTMYLILVANSVGVMREIGYVNNVAILPITVHNRLPDPYILDF